METSEHNERVLSALASLAAMLGECVIDVWKPLRSEARERLSELFDAAIKRIALDLQQSGFGLIFTLYNTVC